jgi:hypothetical protein
MLLLVAAPAAHAVTFSNPAPVTINDAGTGDVPAAATPYPSSISVSGVTGFPSSVGVTLHGFSHACPTDVDMMLVDPLGRGAILMSDAGDCSSNPRGSIELSFQEGLGQIPCIPTGSLETLQGGAYAPTNRSPSDADACDAIGPNPSDVFNSPAPQGLTLPHLNSLGIQPNGSWQLYVMDQYNGDSGGIAGGWTLSIAIRPPQLAGAPSISGPADVGKLLTASTGPIVSEGTAAYQWYRCGTTSCTAIPGATTQLYTPVKADRGKTLEVSEHAVNSGGSSATLNSAPTAQVGPPRLSSSTKRIQHVLKQKGVILKALADLPGTLRATGTVAVPKASKVVRLRAVKRTLKAKRRVTVKLGLTKSARKAIARALHGGAKLKAKVKLVITDAGGGRSTGAKTVLLRA